MKRHIFSIFAVGLVVCAANGQAPAPTQSQSPAVVTLPVPEQKTDFSKIFKSDKERNGYAVGMNTAASIKSRLKTLDLEIDADAVAKGFADTMGAGPSLITEAQEHEILGDLNKEIAAKREQKRQQQAEEMRAKGEKNKEEGATFLAKNKTEPGVVTLESGLQYKVISEGTGPLPKPEDTVKVNYVGTLTDGSEFDSSLKRGQPLTTKVQVGIIKGWTEALEHMKVGSKWKIFVPSDLAYGPMGRPPLIAPNAVLIFELELISVQEGAPQAATPTPIHPSAALTSDIIKVPSAEEIKKGAKIETIKAEDIDKEKAKSNQ